MIQFNLLPSVKVEYIRAQRTKRLVLGIAVLAAAIALAIFVLLFVNVNVLQKRHMTNLTNEINKNIGEIQAIENIDKVLTVQNQLNALSALHEQKPAAQRTLSYLSQLTPEEASVAQAKVDFTVGTITINGTTNSLVTVNKFVDTLKFAKYTSEAQPEQKEAFSEVVLTAFSVDNEEATYQIDFKFDPVIFNNTQDVKLIVPKIISTRSQTEKPSDLFQPQPESSEEDE